MKAAIMRYRQVGKAYCSFVSNVEYKDHLNISNFIPLSAGKLFLEIITTSWLNFKYGIQKNLVNLN